jgi:pyruvate dehydrogenase E1 component alpha subunit
MSLTITNLEPLADLPGTPQRPSTRVAPGPEVAASPSDPNMLHKLYEAMLRSRIVGEHVRQLPQSRRPQPQASLRRGLEATAVGSMIEMRAGDAISSELGLPAYLHSGLPLGLYFAELHGMCSEYLAFAPEAANSAIHVMPRAQTVAARLNIAAGFALALKKSESPKVVLVHLLDGLSALGYWHEAATLALAERLPMIFVVISEVANASSVGKSDARQRAEAYGMPGIAVDGGDAVAMWRVAQESIHRARSGTGPTLIDSQLATAAANSDEDPLRRMQHYLEKRRLWKVSWRNDLTQGITREIADAESFFRRSGESQ